MHAGFAGEGPRLHVFVADFSRRWFLDMARFAQTEGRDLKRQAASPSIATCKGYLG
ncbi:hypothetical protein A2U01_0102410, partial [Trifolium medium]|nr:hypothetical protein [Trifolium medium]